MDIKSIKLVNFRNHLNKEVNFTEGLNVISGVNAAGKTSIVESIYFTSNLKSFKTNSDFELINFNSDFAKILVKSEDNFEIVISQSTKKCVINGVLYKKQSEFIGNLKTVIFSPETIDILLKSPSTRRKYLDMFICMIERSYIYTVKEFNHVVKQRNDYLKQMYINALSDKTYFEILNDKYIKLSVDIYEMRSKYIKMLNEEVYNIFNNFFNFKFELKYEIQSKIDLNNLEDSLRTKLSNNFERELALGNTITGPIKDDIVFAIDDHDAKYFASKGQQRIALISLKLAEAEVIKNSFNYYPIIILDDVLSELDDIRQNELFEFLSNKDLQTIITTTDINEIKNDVKYNLVNL